MTWVRLDDRFFMHPKVLAVGPAAAWLWVASIAYANTNMTDGRVPTAALPLLAHVAPAKARELAAKLVAARLWEEAEGGYAIHDYHDWNPSAEQVRSHREHLSKVRSESGRAGGKQSGVARAEAKAKQVASDVASVVLKQNPTPSPSPTPTEEPPIPPQPPAGAPPAPPVGVGDAPPASDPDAPVRAVFEHWRAVMGKGPRALLTDKRATRVRARLAEGYSVAELQRAVDGCKASPHHQGRNDTGTVYDELELICRDQAHVDMFLRLAPPPPAPPAAPKADPAAYAPPRPVPIDGLDDDASAPPLDDTFTNLPLMRAAHG